MGESTDNPVADAASRLEAAVSRLATAAGAARQAMQTGADGATVAEGASREEVRALAERLDVALAKLRSMLGEED